jgi:hypothetical protein
MDKKSALNTPSGSLTNPFASVMPTLSGPLTLLTKGPTGSGKTTAVHAALWSAMNPHLKLPTGDVGLLVRPADKDALTAARARLKHLMLNSYRDERYRDVEDFRVLSEVLERADSHGTAAAIHFCDKYLMLSGDFESLGKVGNVLIPLNYVHRLTEQNIYDVTRVCVMIHDAETKNKAASDLLDLTFDNEGRGAEIAALVNDRGITDAAVIRGLLSDMDGVESAVHGGVL